MINNQRPKHQGSAWVVESMICPEEVLSPLGKTVADLLGDLFHGLYHLPIKHLRRVNWQSPYYIRIPVKPSAFSTYDFDRLTEFVFLCHEYCVRGAIAPCNGQYVYLEFTPRQREGRFSERHPTLSEAVCQFLK